MTDMHRADRLAATVCPACLNGIHEHCILQGCYCPCLPEFPPDDTEMECVHGLVRSMCEQCEQEEQ